MPKLLTPGASYKGRPPDVAVVNITISREAESILRQYGGGPGRKRLGRAVERFIWEHLARKHERERMQRILDRDEAEDEQHG